MTCHPILKLLFPKMDAVSVAERIKSNRIKHGCMNAGSIVLLIEGFAMVVVLYYIHVEEGRKN